MAAPEAPADAIDRSLAEAGSRAGSGGRRARSRRPPSITDAAATAFSMPPPAPPTPRGSPGENVSSMMVMTEPLAADAVAPAPRRRAQPAPRSHDPVPVPDQKPVPVKPKPIATAAVKPAPKPAPAPEVKPTEPAAAGTRRPPSRLSPAADAADAIGRSRRGHDRGAAADAEAEAASAQTAAAGRRLPALAAVAPRAQSFHQCENGRSLCGRPFRLCG